MYPDKAIPNRFEALRAVCAAFETQQAMADAFGVSQPTVWRWTNQSKQLPAEYVLRAEHLTGVSRYWLRPDIYPVEHAGSPITAYNLCPRGEFVHNDNRAVPKRNVTRTLLAGGAQ